MENFNLEENLFYICLALLVVTFLIGLTQVKPYNEDNQEKMAGVKTMQSRTYRPKLDVVVVCPNGFSNQAKHTAKKNKVLLVDTFDLCAAYRGESNPFCFNNIRRIGAKPFELFIDKQGNLKNRTNVYI